MYDIGIIGSGSAGYVSAIRGAQLGKKVCLAEKHELGGVCLNRGCIPTKALLASVDLVRNIKRANEFGIEIGQPERNWHRIIERKEAIVKKLGTGIRALLKQNGVEILQGEATIVEPGWLKVDNKKIRTQSIIICTGSSPIIPFKTSGANIFTSDDILTLDSLPKSILIIGAGAIGVEFATIFAGLGSAVTLIEMLPSILPEIKDNKVIREMKDSLKSQGIKIIENAKVEKICGKIVSLSTGDELATETILVACGRIPNSDGFKGLGLKVQNKNVAVDTKMQTSISGIYAAGDVTGPPLLAHKASHEGIIAAQNACGIDSVMDYSAVPNCIFSHPELAWVGKFESEIQEARVGEYRFQGVGKAWCLNETDGFVKVVTDKDYILKGVQIIGAHASDIIPICMLGVKNGLHAQELAELIYPHPTLSECLKEALLDVTHSAIHKYRC